MEPILEAMALTGVDVRSIELVAGEDIEVEVELAVLRCVTQVASVTDVTHANIYRPLIGPDSDFAVRKLR